MMIAASAGADTLRALAKTRGPAQQRVSEQSETHQRPEERDFVTQCRDERAESRVRRAASTSLRAVANGASGGRANRLQIRRRASIYVPQQYGNVNCSMIMIAQRRRCDYLRARSGRVRLWQHIDIGVCVPVDDLHFVLATRWCGQGRKTLDFASAICGASLAQLPLRVPAFGSGSTSLGADTTA